MSPEDSKIKYKVVVRSAERIAADLDRSQKKSLDKSLESTDIIKEFLVHYNDPKNPINIDSVLKAFEDMNPGELKTLAEQTKTAASTILARIEYRMAEKKSKSYLHRMRKNR